MARVLVDTSAVYALLDRNDRRHEDAVRSLRQLQRSRAEPLLTNFVRAESHALLLARLGHEVARAWLAENAWRVERVTEDDEAHAAEIVLRYSDKTYSLTDATTFAVMRRLRIRRAFTYDRHFEQFGFEGV